MQLVLLHRWRLQFYLLLNRAFIAKTFLLLDYISTLRKDPCFRFEPTSPLIYFLPSLIKLIGDSKKKEEVIVGVLKGQIHQTRRKSILNFAVHSFIT